MPRCLCCRGEELAPRAVCSVCLLLGLNGPPTSRESGGSYGKHITAHTLQYDLQQDQLRLAHTISHSALPKRTMKRGARI